MHLAFTVPKEGANGSFDALLIPADAPHPLAAHQFLNFMLEPRVIAAITNEIHYANDNRAADAYVDPQILQRPGHLSDAGGRGAAVQRAGSRAGARAAAHAHLDAHQDEPVTRPVRATRAQGRAPPQAASGERTALFARRVRGRAGRPLRAD